MIFLPQLVLGIIVPHTKWPQHFWDTYDTSGTPCYSARTTVQPKPGTFEGNFSWWYFYHTPSGPNAFGTLTLPGPLVTESRNLWRKLLLIIFFYVDLTFAWESLSHTSSGPNAFGTLTTLLGPLLLWQDPWSLSPGTFKGNFYWWYFSM